MATSETSFDYLCRACMHQLAETSFDASDMSKQQCQSIFEPIEEYGNLRIAEVLSNTIPQIEVQSSDELPKKICCKCLRQLMNAYQFQQQCLETDQRLRELIANRNSFSYICTEPTVKNVVDFKDTSVQESREQGMGFECVDALPLAATFSDADPFKIVSNAKKHYTNFEDYVSDYEEIASDGHNAEYSDNETLISTASAKYDVITKDMKTEQLNLALPSHVCPTCNKSYKALRFLKNHMKIHRKKDAEIKEILTEYLNIDDHFKCDVCDRHFKKLNSLNKHRLMHGEKTNDKLKSHACDLCKKMYSSRLTLERHKRLRHSTVLTPIELKSRNNSKNLKATGNPDISLKSLSCTFCEKVCKNSEALRQHVRRHKAEPVLCPQCGKSISCEGGLKTHLLRHGDDKPYECPHCPRKFPCVSDLYNHKKIHEAKRHICNICGSAFTQPYELKNHKKHHSGERPYKCDYCEKRFVRIDQQRRHMRTHTGEKPFKCRYCDRAFAQSNDHVKHLRTHLGDNIYRCDLCPLAFRLASLRRQHFATHKNDDEETRERNLKALKEEEAKLANLACQRSHLVLNSPWQQEYQNEKIEMSKTTDSLFNYLCRTCLHEVIGASSFGASTKPQQQWKSIFDTIEECGTIEICNLISKAVPEIEVQLNDDLPKKICCKCADELVCVYRFQQMCIEADQQLRDMIAKTNTCSIITEDSGQAARATIEAPVQQYPQETKVQRVDLKCSKILLDAPLTSGVDPLQSINDIMEHCKDPKSDDSDFVKDELCDYEPHDVIFSDNETSQAMAAVANEVIMAVETREVEKANLVRTLHFNAVKQLKEKDKPKAKSKKKITISSFKCDICNRHFHKAESLQNHRLAHDAKPNDIITCNDCDLCGRTYSSRRALMRHKRVRHPTETLQRQHTCEFCKKIFKSSVVLKKHTIRKHTTEVFLCPECGKSFNTERKLKGHRLRHSDDKPYECPQCPLRFSCPGNLSNHKKMHSLKQHVCNICGSAFKQRHRLEQHKKLHNGEKPYKCDYCEMCFVRPDHKRRHMRIHTGEKPYKCKYCNRSFSQSGDLVKHLRRIHVGDNVYRCELCPLAFRLASLRRQHFALHKNEDEKTRELNMKALKDEEAKLAKLYSDGLQPQ
ncbi:zinc finger protein 493-like [Eurosta solidaginis]|uniref:zinc finger protein 493-like n=1 Tax=Eurosta solidaginis TaxID=178769 RepID=UPI00353132F0